ncbi:hypothetical protein RLOatenuis_2290 [Rickettsiales bacterium]|nr:hypothetical protein RLOatenuis_2290 [Rickettsiales bacterium]
MYNNVHILFLIDDIDECYNDPLHPPYSIEVDMYGVGYDYNNVSIIFDIHYEYI